MMSWSLRIVGSGTSSTPTSLTPRQVTAFIAHLPWACHLGPGLQERPAGGRRPLAVRCGIHGQHLADLDELLGLALGGPQFTLRLPAPDPARSGARRPPVAQPARQLGAFYLSG